MYFYLCLDHIVKCYVFGLLLVVCLIFLNITLGKIQNTIDFIEILERWGSWYCDGALPLYSEICISLSTSRLFYMLIWWQESLIKILWGKIIFFCNHSVLFKVQLCSHLNGNYRRFPFRNIN